MKSHRRTFLKQAALGAAGLSLVWSWRDCRAESVVSLKKLPGSSPEAQGVSSGGILAFLAAVAGSKHEFHSFMMLRHGHVIAEGWWSPYQARLNHMLYSFSKSFTSTPVGFPLTQDTLKDTPPS